VDLKHAYSSPIETDYFSMNLRGLYIIIRLEARLHPNIGFTLQRVLVVFTCSAITPPKEHSEYSVGGWPWHILGAIRAAATAGEPGEIFFVR